MKRFRLLYLHNAILENVEEVEARDILEAVEKASGKPPHLKVEIWSDQRRVGEIGPALAS